MNEKRPALPALTGLRFFAASRVGVPLVALLALAWGAVYVRYMADDFSYADGLRAHGFLADQVWWYQHWSGRFSSTLASSLAEWVGAWDGPLVLWLVLAVWLVGLWRLCRPQPFLAPLLIVATLVAAPDVPQSLYWQMGLLSYVAPLAIGTWAVWAVVTNRPLVAGVLCLVAGGFSETYVLAQTATALLAASGAWRVARPWFPSILAAVAGSCGALVLVAVAPGNAVRSALLPPHPTPLFALAHGVRDAGSFLTGLAPLLALLAVIGLVLPREGTRLPGPLLLLLPAGLFLVCLAAITPSWYELDSTAPDRALIVPAAVAVCAALAWGMTLRRLLAPRTAGPLLLAATFLVSVHGVIRAHDWQTAAAPYAAAWDARDALLRHAQGGVAYVHPLVSPAGTAEVRPGPDSWILPAVAQYYGVRAIRFRPYARPWRGVQRHCHHRSGALVNGTPGRSACGHTTN